jgi:hypothetical protein
MRARVHFTFHADDGGESGPEAVLEALDALLVEDDLNRDALDNLREVARGVVGGKERELRPVAGATLSSLPVKTWPPMASIVTSTSWPAVIPAAGSP